MRNKLILKAALWARTFWAVSFCHFSPWIYPFRKNKYGCTCHFNIASPTGTPQEQNSLYKIRLHNWKPKEKKTQIPEKGWGVHSCWICVFIFCFFWLFFFVFGVCVFLVVLLIVPPVYRGGFTLTMFSPLPPVSPSILSHTLSLGLMCVWKATFQRDAAYFGKEYCV